MTHERRVRGGVGGVYIDKKRRLSYVSFIRRTICQQPYFSFPNGLLIGVANHVLGKV